MLWFASLAAAALAMPMLSKELLLCSHLIARPAHRESAASTVQLGCLCDAPRNDPARPCMPAFFHSYSVVGVLSAFYGVTGTSFRAAASGWLRAARASLLGSATASRPHRQLHRLSTSEPCLTADRLLEVSSAAQTGDAAGMKAAYDKLLHWHEGVACKRLCTLAC